MNYYSHSIFCMHFHINLCIFSGVYTYGVVCAYMSVYFSVPCEQPLLGADNHSHLPTLLYRTQIFSIFLKNIASP